MRVCVNTVFPAFKYMGSRLEEIHFSLFACLTFASCLPAPQPLNRNLEKGGANIVLWQSQLQHNLFWSSERAREKYTAFVLQKHKLYWTFVVSKYFSLASACVQKASTAGLGKTEENPAASFNFFFFWGNGPKHCQNILIL